MEEFKEPTTRPKRRGPSLFSVVFLAIIFGMLAGFGGTLAAFWAVQQGHVQIPGLQASAGGESGGSTPIIVPSGGEGPVFSTVAAALNESVVNINTLARNEDPFSLFFGAPREVQGLGTGIIVDNEGHILTNYHVVGEADNIKVTVTDRNGDSKEYDATFIGGDQQEDLALVKINASNLRPVRFGDSDKLSPGQWVMAIGNPYGFEHTVSVGVISALNRSLPVDDTLKLRGMVQTDASINPGNSGGPLVNGSGEVIGINTAVFVGRGGGQPQANSIGFAIPSNRAKHVMEQLRKHGRIQHPYVGISYRLITEELRRQERLPVKSGVLVLKTYPKGPADRAGIKEGDIVTKIDGKTLKDENTLGDHIKDQEIGTKVTFEVQSWDMNSGAWKKKQVSVKIEDMPKEFLQRMNQQPQEQPQPEQPEEGGRRVFPFPWPF